MKIKKIIKKQDISSIQSVQFNIHYNIFLENGKVLSMRKYANLAPDWFFHYQIKPYITLIKRAKYTNLLSAIDFILKYYED